MSHPRASAGSLAAALARFLCPGGGLRLSPWVEAVQCAVLFGEQPDASNHRASVRTILAKPGHAGKLRALGETFLHDADASRFDEYAQDLYLDLYLAHYF